MATAEMVVSSMFMRSLASGYWQMAGVANT